EPTFESFVRVAWVTVEVRPPPIHSFGTERKQIMREAAKKRIRSRDEGFTLIELMVVVLIIAILIAIAIPTFLGARKRAQDRASQSNLRNALTAEKVYYTDSQKYTTDLDQLTSIEPSLTWVS